jgi:hypothetical protein
MHVLYLERLQDQLLKLLVSYIQNIWATNFNLWKNIFLWGGGYVPPVMMYDAIFIVMTTIHDM